MMEVPAYESFHNFMEIYGPTMQITISYDDYHELHLSLKEVLTVDNFSDVEEPDLADDVSHICVS